MNVFQKGAKLGLVFNTSRGVLSISDLYRLKLSHLAQILKGLSEELGNEENDSLSFLDETRVIDENAQLRFEIAKAIYLDKKADRDAIKNEAEVKAHNQKILDLIQRKKDKELEEMSLEDLQKQLK